MHASPEEKKKRKAPFTVGLAAAVVSGTIHASIEQPLFTPIGATITQTQVNGHSFRENFMDLFRRRALYRSLPAALTAAIPKSIIHYAVLNSWMETLLPNGDLEHATPMEALSVGVCTGVSEPFLTTPLNFIKYRMQRPEWGYSGTVDCIRTVYRQEGITAFWKGLGPICARNPICMGMAWYSFRKVEDYIPEGTRGRGFIAGGVGGILGSFLSYPFEMLRAAHTHHFNLLDHLRQRGPRRLFAGWVPGALHLTISSALMGVLAPNLKPAKEALTKVLVPNHDPGLKH